MRISTRTSIIGWAAAVALIGLCLPQTVAGMPKSRGSFAPVEEVPAGLSVAYLFRSPKTAMDLQLIFANGRLVGGMTAGTYIPLFVRPGELFLDSIYPGHLATKTLPVTLNVEPGQEYDLIEPMFYKSGLMVADDKVVEKRRGKSGVLAGEPGFVGFYHYYQADVFVDLAARQDRAGHREAAQRALGRAAEHYASAASGFRLPIPKKMRKHLQARGLFGALSTMVDRNTIASRRSGLEGVITPLENPFRSNQPEDPLSFEPNLGDLSPWANRMEELSKQVAAAHDCYGSEEQPSLEQCCDTLEGR